MVGYGGRLLTVAYRDDGTPDLRRVAGGGAARTPAIVYLANPDNPSGRFIARDEIARFYEALPHDTLLLLDEAYADFVDEDELLAPSFDDRLIRLRTFSKAYGMAGARIGYALAHRAQHRRRSRRFGCTTASTATRRSARSRRSTTRRFGGTSSRKRRAARDEYYGSLGRWARAFYRVAHELRLHRDRTRAQRATRVMDELLATGVFGFANRVRRRSTLHPRERRHRTDARAFGDALRSVLCARLPSERCGTRSSRTSTGTSKSLERALSTISRRGRSTLCLGDVVGYGPNPNECVAAIARARPARGLGNHDLAAVENFGVESTSTRGARGDRLDARACSTQTSRAWLNSLPYELRLPEFLLVHGAPVNYFEYILDKARPRAHSTGPTRRIVFVGHTHIAEYWARDADGTIGHKHMQQGGELSSTRRSGTSSTSAASVNRAISIRRPASSATIRRRRASSGFATIIRLPRCSARCAPPAFRRISSIG